MFAGPVTCHLKPGKFDLVTHKFEEKVISTLRSPALNFNQVSG
jgi:hypothetical protein